MTSLISNLFDNVRICDMLISCKALRYQSCSLILNICPHFQDHHKVHCFHQNTSHEYFEYFRMDLHLFHDSALQDHLLRPFTFPQT